MKNSLPEKLILAAQKLNTARRNSAPSNRMEAADTWREFQAAKRAYPEYADGADRYYAS